MHAAPGLPDPHVAHEGPTVYPCTSARLDRTGKRAQPQQEVMYMCSRNSYTYVVVHVNIGTKLFCPTIVCMPTMYHSTLPQ